VKKVENKIVYYKETVECQQQILARKSEESLIHIVRPEPNWRVSVDWVPVLVSLRSISYGGKVAIV
jgi:hypothetical protein